MTTYTIYSDSADGWIYSTNATYATARAGSGLLADIDPNLAQVGQAIFGDYEVYEAFVSFNTSSVVGVVSAATLSLYSTDGGAGSGDFSTTNFTLNARRLDFGTLTTGDWIAGASLSGQTLLASRDTSSGWATGYVSLTSVAAFLTNINKSGTTGIILCSSRQEGNNTPTNSEYVNFSLSEEAGTTEDPRLVVEAAPAAGLPPRRRLTIWKMR